jgi:hypothetical protein
MGMGQATSSSHINWYTQMTRENAFKCGISSYTSLFNTISTTGHQPASVPTEWNITPWLGTSSHKIMHRFSYFLVFMLHLRERTVLFVQSGSQRNKDNNITEYVTMAVFSSATCSKRMRYVSLDLLLFLLVPRILKTPFASGKCECV